MSVVLQKQALLDFYWKNVHSMPNARFLFYPKNDTINVIER